GNGNYAYIDTHNEAVRVLGENLVATLQVVAKDVKIQVEFDASVVERWRLIGYENRLLQDDQFDDDEVDAGDIGAGHSVTALYEIDLTSEKESHGGSLAEVRLRYKEPSAADSTEHIWSMMASEGLASFDEASPSFRFGAAVTEFAEILRDSPHSSGTSFNEIILIGASAAPADARSPSKQEFLDLVSSSRDLFEIAGLLD
ncbi:MAG TPA: VWA domain-containing protein, partial [Deltaproteobacteria bacterium]|nr:VWA domain-containing protein [Deltaproteobacteria bacterium]